MGVRDMVEGDSREGSSTQNGLEGGMNATAQEFEGEESSCDAALRRSEGDGERGEQRQSRIEGKGEVDPRSLPASATHRHDRPCTSLAEDSGEMISVCVSWRDAMEMVQVPKYGTVGDLCDAIMGDMMGEPRVPSSHKLLIFCEFPHANIPKGTA